MVLRLSFHPAMVRPPDTLSTWPVINAASSLARKQIAPGRSPGSPLDVLREVQQSTH